MAADFIHIYIADDDDDDCMLFGDVLAELQMPAKLTTASNGTELMGALKAVKNVANFPHLLFLDLNMPMKNGLECLMEIKQDPALRHLPVIMYSTSAQKEAVDSAYKIGAARYFKKPNSFAKLKQVLEKILSVNWNNDVPKPGRDEFLIDV